MDKSIAKLTTKFSNPDDKFIIINQGPQFRLKGGYIMAFIFIIFLVFLIASAIHGEYLISFYLFLIDILLLNIFIDIRGIKIDKEHHKIKDYKWFFGIKIGKWSDLNNYKSIYLVQKNVIIPTSEYSEYSADTYHYYQIKLVDEVEQKDIFLAEYNNYYKAHNIATFIAKTTGIEFKDFLKGAKGIRIHKQ